jgi:hypothetical protein
VHTADLDKQSEKENKNWRIVAKKRLAYVRNQNCSKVLKLNKATESTAGKISFVLEGIVQEQGWIIFSLDQIQEFDEFYQLVKMKLAGNKLLCK